MCRGNNAVLLIVQDGTSEKDFEKMIVEGQIETSVRRSVKDAYVFSSVQVDLCP